MSAAVELGTVAVGGLRVIYPDDVSFGGFAVGFDAAWLADFDHDRLIRVELSD